MKAKNIVTKKEEKSNKNRKKNKDLNKEILGIIIISIGILILVSMYNESTGFVGNIIKQKIWELTGFGGYLIPYIVIIIGVLFTINRLKLHENKKSISILIIYFCFLTILDIKEFPFQIEEFSFLEKTEVAIVFGEQALGGGLIGSSLGYLFINLFGIVGSYIIIISMSLIAFLFLTNISIVKFLRIILNKLTFIFKMFLSKLKDFIKSRKTNQKNPNFDLNNKETTKLNKLNNNNLNDDIEKKIKILDYTKDSDYKIEKDNNDSGLQKNKSNKKDIPIQDINIPSNERFEGYELPRLDFLGLPDNISNYNEKKEILGNARKLEIILDNFGIKADVVQISKGPTITRYELQPAPGVKVSKIVNLSNDIALGLASSDIRIEAPIPGKAAIGIEVPNKLKVKVRLREVLESNEYKEINSRLSFALGKDIAGKPIVANIEKMPHLLIAGATGSGKSVCINTLITSLLYKSKPDQVKLLMIDPKVVELSIYNGIPHLLIPVVTDPKKAAGALNWAVQEMTSRYNLFAKNGVRDITSYNGKIQEKNECEKLPQIVIIIDELADLMLVSPTEVEDSICRIAQLARAAGIHLIVATQRPSVDIITGTIKANIPSRLSFAVSSQADSRTILDMGGAEKLLGNGDMLFYPVGESKPKRIQGAYIDEKEVEKIVSFLKSQNEVDYKEEIISNIEKKANTDIKNTDELLSKAIELVVNEGQASISFLQRKLRIGYARAARLVDEMEERGIIGGYEGSKPRKVLVNKEDFE